MVSKLTLTMLKGSSDPERERRRRKVVVSFGLLLLANMITE